MKVFAKLQLMQVHTFKFLQFTALRLLLKKYGNNNNEIEIAEYTINQYSDDILRDIYKRKPDAVGFSCYIWNIGMVKEIVRDYKKICPNVDVCRWP